jgi:hypothetical protein
MNFQVLTRRVAVLKTQGAVLTVLSIYRPLNINSWLLETK